MKNGRLTSPFFFVNGANQLRQQNGADRTHADRRGHDQRGTRNGKPRGRLRTATTAKLAAPFTQVVLARAVSARAVLAQAVLARVVLALVVSASFCWRRLPFNL